MGTYCELRSVSPDQVDAISRHPALVQLFWTEGWEHANASLLRRLVRRVRPIPEAMRDLSCSMAISLDKAWHGIHFLLTNGAQTSTFPASFILEGGQLLDSDSRLFTPQQAVLIRHFIDSTSVPSLRSHYLPEAMEKAGIYPEVIWRREGDEAFEWLLEFWGQISPFFRDVVSDGHGVIVTIS